MESESKSNFSELSKKVNRYLSNIIASDNATNTSVDSLTIMLTETCNLDCWMCDFRKSNKLTKPNPLGADGIIHLLQQDVFSSLRTITLTGGEPFAFKEVDEVYQAISRKMPHVSVFFSSNCTMPKKMEKTFDRIKHWHKAKLFVSVDGIDKHDEQRGENGLFEKTVKNIDGLKQRYPDLNIIIKFTITPVNHDELEKAYRYFNNKGFEFRGKLIELNPNYTSKISIAEHSDSFIFQSEQIKSVQTQLQAIINYQDLHPEKWQWQGWQEILDSTQTHWRRSFRCKAPLNSGFIDCDLNFFTCKEYDPIINLRESNFSALDDSAYLQEMVKHEKANTGRCERCTSPMRRIKARR